MAFEHLIKLSLSVTTLLSVIVLGQHNVIRFNKAEITGIVEMHNDLRRSIYNAANMRELSWNEAVAMAASEWGTECEYVTRPDNHWGQNMNYVYGGDYHKTALDLFTDSFNSWSNETVHYDYRRYRSCGRKNVCSYVQLIAAEAEQIGCSIVKCPRLQLKDPYGIQTHAKMLVCFYTPWIDINNKEVFIPEERCSACPTGTVCVDNLCSGRFSGQKSHKHNSIGESRINIGISSISGSRPDPKDKKGLQQAGSSQNQRDNRGHRRPTDTIVGRNKIVSNPDIASTNTASGEHGSNRVSIPSNKASEDHVVVYTPNNRVVPFPGKKESRDIRRIEKYERKLERKNKKDKKKKKSKTQAELVQKPEKVAAASTKHTTNATQTVLSRKKRQLSYEDAVYMRRLEHHRYLKEQREREIQDRERRHQYEEQIRRRNNHHRRHREMMELRRLTDNQRSMNNQRVIDNQRLIDGRRLTDEQRLIEARRISDEQRRIQEERERRRLRRLREHRKRQELMALLQSEGELTGEEQFNTISAHNILRRADGARELSWSSHLEKWAKYVIRCETEYPGPISCSTNFGKANGGQEIYNVVYEWGAEGDDLRRPLKFGCRTPYDQSLCNHNSILRDKSLKQMACAAKNCGLQRQLTCIYNSS